MATVGRKRVHKAVMYTARLVQHSTQRLRHTTQIVDMQRTENVDQLVPDLVHRAVIRNGMICLISRQRNPHFLKLKIQRHLTCARPFDSRAGHSHGPRLRLHSRQLSDRKWCVFLAFQWFLELH